MMMNAELESEYLDMREDLIGLLESWGDIWTANMGTEVGDLAATTQKVLFGTLGLLDGMVLLMKREVQ